VDTRPGRDATGVPTGTRISVTFSEPIWEPEMTLKDQAGTPVPGKAYLGEERTVLFSEPSRDLAAGCRYTVEATGGYDEEGNGAWRTLTCGRSRPGSG